MRFQDSQVELRLRTPDEAVDAGVLLARKYWWRLLGGWLIFAIPAYIVALFIPYTVWAVIFFWWFKPLYERLPLQTVSSAIFQQKFSVKSNVKTLLKYDTFAWLTIFRMCPGRSTLVPIAALEGLESGFGTIRRRRQVVKAPIIGSYFLLHVGMFLCELVMICFGMILCMKFLQPVSDATMAPWQLFAAQWSWAWNPEKGRFVLLSLMFASSAFMAPFYVCTGFALYVNRRIGLEGWDLYLGFQRLVSRLSVVCLLAVVLAPSIDLVAQEDSPSTSTNSEVQIQMRTEVNKVMHQQVLREKTMRIPKLRESENVVRSENLFMEAISILIQLSLLAMAIVLVGWIIIKLRIWEFVTRRFKAIDDLEPNVTIASEERKKHETPSEVVSGAIRAWQQGHAREALSLLYQGALLYLIVNYSCPIEICDTERTCARVIAKRVPTHSNEFSELSLNWQQVAYGKKTLADHEFNRIIALYEDSFA